MARIKMIEKLDQDADAGCAWFTIRTTAGAGAERHVVGEGEVQLPLRTASMRDFVTALGGEAAVRRFAIAGKLAAFRASLRPSAVSDEGDLD